MMNDYIYIISSILFVNELREYLECDRCLVKGYHLRITKLLHDRLL